MSLATEEEEKSKSRRYTGKLYKRSTYKVVMYIQKLHHFCNTSSPDDSPKLGRKKLGKKLIYQPIPAEYHKINTAIRKD